MTFSWGGSPASARLLVGCDVSEDHPVTPVRLCLICYNFCRCTRCRPLLISFNTVSCARSAGKLAGSWTGDFERSTLRCSECPCRM